MSFATKYAKSAVASNLMDDQFHHKAEALMASAFSDMHHEGIGALLNRIKYADGITSRSDIMTSPNLISALRIWNKEVRAWAKRKNWIPQPKTEWDKRSAESFYTKVAETSLSHWIDSRCLVCQGSGLQHDQKDCIHCEGSGKSHIKGERLVVKYALQMVGELENILISHNQFASRKLRS